MLVQQPPQVGRAHARCRYKDDGLGQASVMARQVHPRRGAPSSASPGRLWEGPAALKNKEIVCISAHTCMLLVHACWLLRWSLRITNRCGRVRYAVRRSYPECLAAVENLLANRSISSTAVRLRFRSRRGWPTGSTQVDEATTPDGARCRQVSHTNVIGSGTYRTRWRVSVVGKPAVH